MIVKEHVIRRCECKKNMIVEPAIYRCDSCDARIANPDKPKTVKSFQKEVKDTDYGEIHISNEYHFCSWACLLTKLPMLTDRFDYFLWLPHPNAGEDFAALLEAIKTVGASW